MKYALRLFVTGKGGRSQQALDNIQAICNERLSGQYKLEVIDILDNPQQAEEQKILVTPTLIRDLPAPRRRLVGDLSLRGAVLTALDLTARDTTTDARRASGGSELLAKGEQEA
jgi:circadian clock protein KaiB